jgi:hypothetical protein
VSVQKPFQFKPVKKCSYCGRQNTDDASDCSGCGTEFPGGSKDSQTSPDASDNPERAAAEKRMLHGAIWCIGGILVTLLTYAAAANSPGGGTYIVAWGAIVFGARRFFQGLSSRNAGPSHEDLRYNSRHTRRTREDLGYEELAHGARLERKGQVQEALAAYQTVVEEYPHTNASEDAKKSIESLQAKIN